MKIEKGQRVTDGMLCGRVIQVFDGQAQIRVTAGGLVWLSVGTLRVLEEPMDDLPWPEEALPASPPKSPPKKKTPPGKERPLESEKWLPQ